MKEKLIINRVEFLLEGLEEECIIDSLIRINEDNYDICRGDCASNCYYCVYYFPSETIFSDGRVCSSLMGEDLMEVREV